MNMYVRTMIGCGAGIASAYAIGRICFEIGRDVERLNQLTSVDIQPKIVPIPKEETKPEGTVEQVAQVAKKRRGMFGGINAIKDIIKRPEEHRVEAYLENGETVFRIKKKTVSV